MSKKIIYTDEFGNKIDINSIEHGGYLTLKK